MLDRKFVEVDVESGKGRWNLRLRCPATLAASAYFALVAAAFGANNPIAPCDHVARDLQSLEVTVNDLSIDIDLVPGPVENSLADALEASSLPQDTTAPMLYLTPRVATILEAVFDSTATAPDSEPDGEEGEARDDLSNDSHGAQQKSAPVTVIDKDAFLPRFQRHMYRKDI